MKSRFYRFLILALGLFFLLPENAGAQVITGSKNIVETTFDITDFHTILLRDAYDLEVTQSDEYKVVVVHDDNIKEYLKVSKDKKTLDIQLDKAYEFYDIELTVKVSLPVLRELTANGSGEISIPEVKSDSLFIKMLGASEMTCSVEIAEYLAIAINGAAQVYIDGTAENADMDLGGAGKLVGEDFTVENELSIRGSGAGTVELVANGDIRVNLKGAASVIYYGNAIVVEEVTSDMSGIRRETR